MLCIVYIFKFNSQVTCTYFLFSPHNFGILSETREDVSAGHTGPTGRQLIANPPVKNRRCWLMQHCCSLVLYSREELDQIEWDLLFSLNHHRPIKLTFLCLYFTCTDWTSQLLCVEVLTHHFSLSTLMVLTLFAHILIFLGFHIQILNLKRPPTFLGLHGCGCLDQS